MKKTLISILGTNDYLECRHSFQDRISNDVVKYVQEDIVKLFCSDWDENSEIRIFLTQEAKKKNWIDNGHNNKDGLPKINDGLFSRLQKLDTKSKIIPYDIPEGYTESDIWKIFEIIYNSFEKNEEVIIDVTHAFRSLPMLLTVLLNYAKQLKNIKVSGIYYAAFEKLGSIANVLKINPQDRIAPILDLTAFSELQNWTIATYDFLSNANTSKFSELIKDAGNTNTSVLNGANNPTDFVNQLDELCKMISLCRGKDLINFDFKKLHQSLDNLKNDEILIKPLAPLFEQIQMKIDKFQNDDIQNGFLAVKWCIDHNLDQQATTFMQENIITKILYDVSTDWTVKKNREIAAQSFAIASRKIEDAKWEKSAAENKELVHQILQLQFFQNVRKLYDKITDIRNDINHGGYTNEAKTHTKLKNKLNVLYENLSTIVFND
ncbi:MAG: TIGR02221 family CRISPR-associated protein [Ignavibacteriales bacterium CG_4_9_14_3_um_filter_30_11]|nr:MAG: TIGR02221 family CRISPR-associated protein [Ignavibacteriales bacterium CG_4_9_14_3_um_filter_30_11]